MIADYAISEYYNRNNAIIHCGNHFNVIRTFEGNYYSECHYSEFLLSCAMNIYRTLGDALHITKCYNHVILSPLPKETP